MTNKPVTEKPKLIKGLGISRDDLKSWLRQKQAEGEQQDDAVKQLYDKEDLSMVTENTKNMVVTKVRMKILLAAQDLERTEPLIQIWIREFNKEMVSFKRQGRLEMIGLKQAEAMASLEERPVSSR